MFTPCPVVDDDDGGDDGGGGGGGGLDLATLRAWAIADAQARFGHAGGPGSPLGGGPNGDAAREPLDALALGFDRAAAAAVDATARRWARWLIGKLDSAGSAYQRSGHGWRLRTSKLHEENERRLDQLAAWSDAALAGQRELLKHVENPGDDGTDLEQSLSKLAAAGWTVDSKKDKKAPAAHFAAGDLPLATGEDWRVDGAVHPRLAAALAFFVGALPASERDVEEPPAATLAAQLPALAVAGRDDATALLDIRTVAKALRDVGGLDLPSGEPLGPVLQVGAFRLRASVAKAAADAETGDSEATGSNGASPALDPNDASALIATRGGEAVRFALLHAAAPERRFRGGDDVVGYAATVLASARELADARLDGSAVGERIAADDGLRRRLAGWCDVAAARSAENHERRDLHRATRNAATLLARIGDFDAAVVAHRGELAGADREAVGIALVVLARLLAPLAPSTAEELWGKAGRPGSPSETAWPQPQREPAGAA